MTAVQTTPATGRLGALARVEALRYARHPVFLIGTALCLLVTWSTMSSPTEDYYTAPMFVAFFLGVFGMVVGFRLTRSLERSAEAIDPAPVSVQQRVGALIAACLLPGAVGLALTLALLVGLDAKADWVLGTWSSVERLPIFLGMGAVSSVGGPLLGVAAARWLRFPGAVVVPVVTVVGWVFLVNGYTSAHQDSTLALVGRMLSPFAFWATQDTQDGPHRVETWRGNPWAHLAVVVLLCVVAALVALLRDAEGPVRETLRKALVVTVLLAVAAVGLAVVTGEDHTTVRSSTGTTGI
jgi:hypothetical protein